jgi:hypothetical protein
MVCMKSLQVAVWSRISAHIIQRYTHDIVCIFPGCCSTLILESVYVIQIHSLCCKILLQFNFPFPCSHYLEASMGNHRNHSLV